MKPSPGQICVRASSFKLETGAFVAIHTATGFGFPEACSSEHV